MSAALDRPVIVADGRAVLVILALLIAFLSCLVLRQILRDLRRWRVTDARIEERFAPVLTRTRTREPHILGVDADGSLAAWMVSGHVARHRRKPDLRGRIGDAVASVFGPGRAPDQEPEPGRHRFQEPVPEWSMGWVPAPDGALAADPSEDTGPLPTWAAFDTAPVRVLDPEDMVAAA